jgi:colicin import membrane protein
MEKFSDKLRAFALAVALHVLVILALLVGLWWTHETRPVSMPGPVIEATLVGPTAAPKARSGAQKPVPAKPAEKPEPPKPEPPKPEPKPAPQPEPPKPEKETPTEVQRQEQVDREKVAALAQQQAEQEKAEQEEKVRQKQVLLEEEKEKKLREEQQKQLADIKKQRESADKSAKLERERLAQLEDRNQKQADSQAQPEAEHESEQAQTGAGGQDDNLMARYAAAIQAAVTNNWNRPDNAQAGLRCSLSITQIPGGDVISVNLGTPCNADEVTRNSIQQAVMKAAPLPYQGYEKVFQRNIRLNFRYDG